MACYHAIQTKSVSLKILRLLPSLFMIFSLKESKKKKKWAQNIYGQNYWQVISQLCVQIVVILK